MPNLPKPKKGAIFYEDSKLYACLANNPIVIKVEFSSALDTSGYFYTEHLVKNPPYAEIINTRWI